MDSLPLEQLREEFERRVRNLVTRVRGAPPSEVQPSAAPPGEQSADTQLERRRALVLGGAR
jgi:hypothetical protein